jgi:hypothetical protein
MDKLKNIKIPFTDESYVMQGLGLREGEQKYICKLGVKQAFINPNYETAAKNKEKGLTEDYALLEVVPNPDFKEERFMPIVLLSSN